MTVPTSVFKILRPSEWQAFERTGSFAGSHDDQRDGFIHLSTMSQVEGTLSKHFAADRELVIVEVRTDAMGSHLKLEASRDGQEFPHLFRPLAASDVERVWTLTEFRRAFP